MDVMCPCRRTFLTVRVMSGVRGSSAPTDSLVSFSDITQFRYALACGNHQAYSPGSRSKGRQLVNLTCPDKYTVRDGMRQAVDGARLCAR